VCQNQAWLKAAPAPARTRSSVLERLDGGRLSGGIFLALANERWVQLVAGRCGAANHVSLIQEKVMRTLFAVVAISLMSLAGAGCQKDHHAHDTNNDVKMSVDGCPHCAGTQTLNADGTCPKCGMKMTK
jgi:hypothetical protein